MRRYFRHFRDMQLVGLVCVTLVFIGFFLTAQLQQLEAEGSGWRRIDLELLQQRMESGDLSDHEAVWYHPETEGSGDVRDGEPRR